MTEHVFVATGADTEGGSRVYHLPSEEDPDKPACDKYRRNGETWARKELNNLPNHRECRQCAGEEINRSHTGTQVCTQIRGLWADDDKEGGSA